MLLLGTVRSWSIGLALYQGLRLDCAVMAMSCVISKETPGRVLNLYRPVLIEVRIYDPTEKENNRFRRHHMRSVAHQRSSFSRYLRI